MFTAITVCNGQKLGSYRILTRVQILFIYESCINNFNNILSQGTVLVCAYLKKSQGVYKDIDNLHHELTQAPAVSYINLRGICQMSNGCQVLLQEPSPNLTMSIT